jgi:hypothetical protein
MQFDTDHDGMIKNSGYPDQTYDIWTATGMLYIYTYVCIYIYIYIYICIYIHVQVYIWWDDQEFRLSGPNVWYLDSHRCAFISYVCLVVDITLSSSPSSSPTNYYISVINLLLLLINSCPYVCLAGRYIRSKRTIFGLPQVCFNY